MTEQLYEIYTDDSGAFTVGQIAFQNDDDIVFKGVDEEGKLSAYYALPRKMIVEMVTDTPYLRKIREYMHYGKEHPYSGWYVLPQLTLNPEGPILTQVLRIAEREGTLVTVGRIGDEELLCGYVREIEKGRVLLDCIDLESARNLSQVKIRVRDLEYIEYGSISNMLLMHANKALSAEEEE